MRKAPRASNPGDEHCLLRLQLLGNKKLLDGRENRVISTTGAPPRHRAFVVVKRKLAIVIVIENRENRAVCHDSSPLFM
jgi:hypothetical protein